MVLFLVVVSSYTASTALPPATLAQWLATGHPRPVIHPWRVTLTQFPVNISWIWLVIYRPFSSLLSCHSKYYYMKLTPDLMQVNLGDSMLFSEGPEVVFDCVSMFGVCQVPTLRYSLTVEDYACDRAAEMERVQQMLEEVEEEKDTETGEQSLPVLSWWLWDSQADRVNVIMLMYRTSSSVL